MEITRHFSPMELGILGMMLFAIVGAGIEAVIDWGREHDRKTVRYIKTGRPEN